MNWLKDKNLIKIFFLFVFWRFSLFLVAFISPIIIPEFKDSFPYYHERLIATSLPHFLWSFGNFDGVHYLGIAKDAYAYQFTQAFFPAYPILIRIFAFFTFGNLLISALIVSNLCFLFALTLFYKLITKIHGQQIAFWSTLFLLAFPTSYYFGAVYTEGLFFLTIISSFFLLENGKIIAASLIGFLASATRLIGLFLAPVIFFGSKKSFWPLLIIPLGFLAYVLYLQIEFNNPLYFLTSQEIFGQGRTTTSIILLPQVFWRYAKILATTSSLTFTIALFELASTIFALIALWFAYKKHFKKEWLIFSLLAILTPTLTGTLTSMPRYVLVAFPMYLVLASIENTIIKLAILITSIILLIITTSLFTQGYWVA